MLVEDDERMSAMLAAAVGFDVRLNLVARLRLVRWATFTRTPRVLISSRRS
jgi:hypothetical protein